MKDISLRILDMECAACVARLDRALEKLPGVQRAQGGDDQFSKNNGKDKGACRYNECLHEVFPPVFRSWSRIFPRKPMC